MIADCERIRLVLQAQLPVSEARAVASHLARCQECEEMFASLAGAVGPGQLDVVLAGAATWLTGVKVGANFLVPFLVSNLGLAGQPSRRMPS